MKIKNDSLNELEELEEQYKSALQDYLAGGGETALERAYELGRKAIADRLGILDMAVIHQRALVIVSPRTLIPQEISEIIKKAAEFFAESMAPFEMTFRGFQESLTALNNLNKTLELSETKFRSVIQAANDAIISSDNNGNIISWNKRAQTIFGYTEEELLGKPLTILMPERFRYIHSRKFERLRTNSEVEYKGKTHESYGLKKDGGEFPIELSTATWETEDGIFFTGIVRDITERKRAKEALQRAHDELEIKVEERTSELVSANEALQTEIAERKRAEEALQRAHDELEMRVQERTAELARANEGVKAERKRINDILETLPVMVCLLTPDYRVAFANYRFREKFGMDNGRHCFDYIFGRSEPCEFCETFNVLKTGKPHHWECIGPDGSSIIDTYDFPFTDTDGSSLILEMDIDITERKQAEEKIREQASLLDNAQEAIGVRSLEHRLIYWNKGAERLYGWTAEEVTGKNPVEFLFKDKEEPPQLIEAKKVVLEKGEWTGELQQITKDGKEIVIESRWTLVYDSEGKPKSILVINTDITEKKKLESQLLRAQRMESIGTLAGGIAHDLNNVLTPTMLSLQMLKQKLKDEQSQKLLTMLENNSQRGADLIKQVLSFARGVEGERNPLLAKHIITEIEKVTKETFPRNIEIRTDIPKDLLTISGDATQLHQVLMNLCVNARDAMPDGGILRISAENFFIDENYVRMNTEAKVGSYVIIAASDTGIGIPPEILDRIFEPFFTTKEFGKGTGLGLSTVLTIVKSHGGFINVDSEIGKGTTFRVYLPAIKTEKEMQNVEEQQLELPIGHGELVLVAEDEDSVREVTVSTLKDYGYKVLTANDGADAVALYAQNKDKIKVVLMDMMMPVMDGYASIKAIRKINPQVKVIVVSGLAEKDKLVKIESTRAQAILPKPYTAEKLLKTIHEVLSAK